MRCFGNPPIFNGAHPYDFRDCFQFHGGGYAADGHIGPVIVICPEPFCGLILSLLYRFKDILVQPFVPNRAVVAFDIGVLLGLAGLDVFDGDTTPRCPLYQQAADIFGAVTPSE